MHSRCMSGAPSDNAVGTNMMDEFPSGLKITKEDII